VRVEHPRCPSRRNFLGRALLCPDHQHPIPVFLPLKNSRRALHPRRVREATMKLRSFLFASWAQHAVVFMFLASPSVRSCSPSPAQPCRLNLVVELRLVGRRSSLSKVLFLIAPPFKFASLADSHPSCRVCSSMLSARTNTGLARVALRSMQHVVGSLLCSACRVPGICTHVIDDARHLHDTLCVL
jgi:hypothetical protein